MKLAALILLFAIFGKMSAAPAYRVAYYRAAPQQQLNLQDELDEAEAEDDDVSEENEQQQPDFSNAAIQDEIQDDDDESDEQEAPPPFHKLFPMPQRNSPGYHQPIVSMMSGLNTESWNVPKNPVKNRQRARYAISENELARQEDEEDSDEDEVDEEEDEEEDDVPEWNALFPQENQLDAETPPNLESSQPQTIQAFRSGMGSRYVYVPTRQLRRTTRPVPNAGVVSRQYVLRNPMPPRTQMMYRYPQATYIRRPMAQMQTRPQYVQMAQRRPQQQVMYMPVRRNTYSPYVNRYMPRYRFY